MKSVGYTMLRLENRGENWGKSFRNVFVKEQ